MLTMCWSLPWVLVITSSQRNTSDVEMKAAAVPLIRAVATCRVVFLDECKWKASPSVSQLESLDNI